MQSSSLNPITPAVWGQTLQQAVDSRHGRQPHQYIVRDSNGTLSVTANPRTDQHKLTIREIVDETRASLRESAQKKQFLEDPQIDVVANNIKTYTKELIDARAEKGIHNGLRMTAKFFSAIGCFALVGIPFYRALVKGDREFKAQADALKAEIDRPAESLRGERLQAAAPTPADLADEKETRVQHLRVDYRQAEYRLTTARGILDSIRQSHARDPEQFASFVTNQEAVVRSAESALEGIRRQLEELGEQPPVAEPAAEAAAAPQIDPRLRGLQAAKERLEAHIDIYKRNMNHIKEEDREDVRTELAQMEVQLESVNESIAGLQQKE